jgi:hypothetical protein
LWRGPNTAFKSDFFDLCPPLSAGALLQIQQSKPATLALPPRQQPAG